MTNPSDQPDPNAAAPQPSEAATSEPVEIVVEQAPTPTTRRRRKAAETAPEPAADPVVEAEVVPTEPVYAAPLVEAGTATAPVPEPEPEAEVVAEAAPAPKARRGRPPKAKSTIAPKPPKAKRTPKAKPAVDDLAQRLQAQIDAQGLSLPAAAAAIGVNQPGLRRILAGASRANARTRPAYEAWLGGAPAKAAAPTRRGRKPAAATPAPKPAPVRGLKAAFRELRRLVAAGAAPAPAPAVRAPRAAKADPALAALAKDKLAQQVHRAPAAARRVIAAALASLVR